MDKGGDYDALLAATRDIVVVMDENGVIEYVNPAADRVAGYGASDLVGESAFKNIPETDRQTAFETFREVVEGPPGTARSLEHRYRTADGSIIWLESRLANRPETDLSGYVVTARDVTKRRERERQLQAMDNVLRHNLRNDLTVIMGHADRLEEESDLDETARTYLQRILDQCDSLLDTADKGRQIVGVLGPDGDIHQVDLASEVRQAAVAVAEDSSVSLAVDTPETAMAECVSQTPLLVRELLDNAVTHADGTANVELSVERTEDHVELVVVDDGPLIPGADRQAIEGDADITQLEHGSGLGLWMVAWIVRCSGGSIRFAAHEGGNRVIVRFMRST